MTGQIVHDHDVARLQFGQKNLLDKGLEDITIHRTVDDRRTADALDPQSRDQGRRLPVTVGGLVDQSLPARGSPPKSRHVRFGPRFIDEDQTPGFDGLRPG